MAKKQEKTKKQKKRRNPLWNLMVTEWRYLLDRKKAFVVVMILFAIAQAIALMSPLVIGMIFNSIQESIASEAQLRRLMFLISLILVIEVGFWAFHGVARLIETRNGFFVTRNYTNSKVKKVLELPVKWHKDHHSGDTIDKINKGSQSIGNFSEYVTGSVMYAILTIVGSIIILLFIDLFAAIFATVFSLVVLFVMFKVDSRLSKMYTELNKFGHKVSSAIFDYISNIITVVTLRLKKTVSKEVDDRLMASYKTHMKTAKLNEIKWGIAGIAIAFMTTVVLIVRAYTDYRADGIILIGTLYILYGYLNSVGRTFYSFAELYGRIVRYDSYIVSAYPIEEAFRGVKSEVTKKLPINWSEIEIKGLDFAYEKEGKKKHMDNINFNFKKGQKIALVGESGSGKSTVLALMRGLYEPQGGEVYCNGKKLDLGLTRLKHHITLIPQDPEIFNNTIGFNITMDLPIKKAEIDKAVEMARFKKVVQRLDKGLQTNVMEKGVSLSGGEKQRLALARGLLAARNSEIVLLDEPTSSVDSLNEMKIHDSLFKEFKGKTIISSIHRLHLLKKFDYIYLFDKGKVVAQGPLKEIKKNPRFARVWKKYGMTKEIKGK